MTDPRQQLLEDLAKRTDSRLWEHWTAASNWAMGAQLQPGMRLSDGVYTPKSPTAFVAGEGALIGTPEQLARMARIARSTADKIMRAYKMGRRAQPECRLSTWLPAWLAKVVARVVVL